MVKTKIVATLGPASSQEKVLVKMVRAGVEVVRLNFSHGTPQEQQANFDLVKKIKKGCTLVFKSCRTWRAPVSG